MAQVKEGARRRAAHAVRRAKGSPVALTGLALCAAALIGVCGFGIFQATAQTEVIVERDAREEALPAEGDPPAPAAHGDVGAASPPTIVVDVGGAVVRPSVVELPADARVNDAIEAAGGLSPDADTGSLNRAAPLSDGAKVHVPRQGEMTAPSAASAGAPSPGEASSSGGPVNINSASLDELDSLPGVGPATAQAIIEDRSLNGPFASIEDIMRVSGIGEKKFDNLKSSICV